ncbi:DDB1- and CUL4-associated factor 17-like [Panonychus citri]|uniref:DDB1- and CUL4-associated factor 17-like n=1 Tax=Panonychus citri TaxID=50023 RepID=UPI002307E948|nr:DDB1- and CUL4-associated factor 17-like [Panonychus citri]
MYQNSVKEPIVRMVNPPNSCQLVRRCETGCVKNIIRYNLSFVGRLIGSDDFYFKEAYRYAQRGRIIQQGDKIFLSSARDVYSIYDDRADFRKKLYSIEKYLKQTRLNEAKMLTFKSPLFHSVLTPRHKFRPSLFVVTDHNRLLHLDFDTGQLFDSIFLGSLERCKFTYIQWETCPNTIAIGSKEIKYKNSNEIYSYIVIMGIMPLKFIACIKIDSNVFVGQKSPLLSDGLLTMREKCPFPDKLLQIYSRDHVFHDDNYLWKTDIDQVCPGGSDNCSECAQGGRIVGRGNHGLPVNVVVKEIPPPMLTVKSSLELFEYGSWPYHIIYSPPGSRDTYIVESLSDEIPIEGGTIMFDHFIEDGQKLFFHYDAMDDRVLALDCHTLTFFRIINHKLSKQFVLSITPPAYLEDAQKRLSTRKKATKNDIMYKSIYGNIEDTETDIYCLMGVDISAKLDQPVVCLFDNLTGKQLKKFKLQFKLEETNDYDVTLDRDLILINETNLSNQSRFFCYRLTRKEDC